VCSFHIWIECYAQLCHVLVLAYQLHMRIEKLIGCQLVPSFLFCVVNLAVCTQIVSIWMKNIFGVAIFRFIHGEESILELLFWIYFYFDKFLSDGHIEISQIGYFNWVCHNSRSTASWSKGIVKQTSWCRPLLCDCCYFQISLADYSAGRQAESVHGNIRKTSCTAWFK